MQQDGTKRQMDQAVLKGQMDYLHYLHSKNYVYRFRLHLNRAGCPFWAALALRLRPLKPVFSVTTWAFRLSIEQACTGLDLPLLPCRQTPGPWKASWPSCAVLLSWPPSLVLSLVVLSFAGSTVHIVSDSNKQGI